MFIPINKMEETKDVARESNYFVAAILIHSLIAHELEKFFLTLRHSFDPLFPPKVNLMHLVPT